MKGIIHRLYSCAYVLALTCAGLLLVQNCFAQPTYAMQNALVTDCEGVLTDSENGPEDGQYDHNEVYTFTICVADASEIIIAFNFFATEPNYDVLTVYDGPNTGAPLLASLTGSIQPPPVLVATSGCVTFHFVSDDNIVAAGWELEWSVEIDEPQPPMLEVVSILDCPMDAITFQFDFPVDCDMMSPAQFSVIGPGSPGIAQVNPLDCMSGELGQLFEVVFSEPLSRPGTYRLLFNGAIQDVCGEWHDVSANVIFELTNCPFDVVIDLIDDACAGDCGRVRAEIIGDAGVAYTFMWSHTAQNLAVTDVCADVEILISVTVTDPVSMSTATAQYTYTPLENPVILNPVADTVCSSRGDHFYQSSLPGGLWYSAIIPPNLQDVGRYQFWRWRNEPGLSMDIVTYVAPNGCEAYDTIYILPVNSGSIEAACLNSSDFIVNGGSPPGGTWSGPNITANGVFSPVAAGSFVVTYTAPNGCSENKRINVEDVITMPDVDTLCSSQEFDLEAVPYGGRWSGPGIVNSIVGRLRPWLVTPNQTYTYVYELEGCSDTMEIYIQELWAGPDLGACDSDSLLYLTQTGTWSGPGTYIPALNAFDISGLGTGEYVYTLTDNGCSDEFRLYVVDPYVDPYEPITFCQEDEWIRISDIADYGPNWGTFAGPTIVEQDDEWYFNPALAGGGMHTIVFEAAGCQDSFVIDVEPFAVVPDYSFCELSPAQTLSADPPGGTWSGPGFLDAQIGLFDPQLLGPGNYPITYTSPAGCVTEDTIEIILWEQVAINGVNQIYCNADTLIQVGLTPADGDFFINGAPAPPQFNPQMLGTGSHELLYTRGSGPCASTRRIFITVLLPIDGEPAEPDSICSGENAVVEVSATGGTGTLTATWDQGLGFGFSHIVNPLNSTDYTVTVTDGCSEPFVSTASVHVHQPFDIEVITGPPVCYDDTSFVEIIPPLPGQYAIFWNLDSIVESSGIQGQPGIYQAEVLELFSGCSQEYEVIIPGPPPLSANFTIIPNQPCIDIIDHEIQVIDLATGYTGGWIDFGDSTDSVPYEPGLPIMHAYDHIGDYTITLIVSNALGCMDTLTRHICVENRVEMYVPNIFTPNGDGANDVLKINITGTGELLWSVFNRFGEKVFEAHSPDAAWDGTYKGKALNPEVFVVYVQYTDQETGQGGEHISTVTLVR